MLVLHRPGPGITVALETNQPFISFGDTLFNFELVVLDFLKVVVSNRIGIIKKIELRNREIIKAT